MTETSIIGFSMSPMQEHLWLLQKVAGIQFTTCTFRICSEVDSDRLLSAIRDTCECYEILRTRFVENPQLGCTVQVIETYPILRTKWLEQAEELERQGSCDPEGMPEMAYNASSEVSGNEGLEAKLEKIASDQYLLVLSIPSLCADASGILNIMREICRRYLLMKDPLCEETPIQYADVAGVFHELLASADTASGRQYWLERQAGAKQLQLPGERMGAEGRFCLSRATSKFHPNLVDRVQRVAVLCETESETVFLTAWAAAIAILAGRSEVMIGVLSDGRNFEGLDHAIGIFARFLPVGCTVGNHESFVACVKRTAKTLREDRNHQEYYDPARDVDNRKIPGFERHCFEYLDLTDEISGTGLQVEIADISSCIDRFSLKLTARIQSSSNAATDLYFDQNIWSVEDATRIERLFHQLLESALESPGEPIGSLDLLGTLLRQQMIFDWNATFAPRPESKCAHELFHEQSLRTPDAGAIEYARSITTFEELDRWSERLAQDLCRRGVRTGDIVGLYMKRSPEMLASLLAVWKAGAAYAPLDAESPKERILHILERSKIAVVLIGDGMEELHLPGSVRWADLEYSAREASGREGAIEAIRNTALPDNLAYVIHTSGSTGEPKGVMISHKALINYVTWATETYRLNQGSFSLVHTPLTFDLTVTSLIVPLLAGACVVLAAEDSGVESVVNVLRDSRRFDIVKITPSHIQMVHELSAEQGLAASAECVVIGGEPLTASAVADWRASVASLRIINEYGPTETTVGCASYEVAEETLVSSNIGIGRPIANTRTYVLNSALYPLPVGAIGELYVAGDGLAAGYAGSPDLTADRFLPDPFALQPGERMYRTGDLAYYLSDGNLQFIGRADQQIKVAGRRVELGEIQAILEQQESVRQAVVFAEPDTHGDTKITACIVCEDNKFSTPELRAFLRDHLPQYMMPSRLLKLPFLPVTAHGKIDYRSLRARAQTATETLKSAIAPRDAMELQVAQIWKEVLGLDSADVKTRFFDLGGNSLSAIRLIGYIRKQFGRTLPLGTLFQEGTIEQLSILLRQSRVACGHPSLVTINSKGTRPPIFCVHAGGGTVTCYNELARWLGPDQPFYAFESAGLSEERPPFTDLKDIAAYFIDALSSFSTNGSFVLSGWSMGGLVALEMACQLLERGRPADTLAIFDTKLPSELTVFAEIHDEASGGAATLMEMVGPLLPISTEQLKLLAPDQQVAHVLRLAKSHQILPPDFDDAVAQRHIRVYKANLQAMVSYEPRPYPGRVVFFLPEQPEEAGQQTIRGWSQLCDKLEIYSTPGTHYSMIMEDRDVRRLAQRLTKSLDSIGTEAYR